MVASVCVSQACRGWQLQIVVQLQSIVVAVVLQVGVAAAGAGGVVGQEVIQLVGSSDYNRIAVQKVAIGLVVLSDTVRVLVPLNWVV